MTRTSRNGDRKRDRCQTRRVEAANPALTVGALSLVPEFSATFGTNFMMQALGFFGDCAPKKWPLRGSAEQV